MVGSSSLKAEVIKDEIISTGGSEGLD